MQQIDSLPALKTQVQAWRKAGQRIAFVPTMGNLHAGHLHLVDVAREHADIVIASIFVNPTQFGPNEDFDSYPRTLEQDCVQLAEHDVDLVYIPEIETLYPSNELASKLPALPETLSSTLCGVSRPAFFQGVANVVDRFFSQVCPDVAIFGEKDFQQLLVIRWLVATAHPNIEIVGVPTVRESDGLAMSSRNGYLTESERRTAAKLYATLRILAEQLNAGAADISALEQIGMAALEHAGFTPDYVSIRLSADLSMPTASDNMASPPWVILAAAWLGKARLIDNIQS